MARVRIPENVAAEEAYLGALLIDAQFAITTRIDPGDFYLQKHRWIYEAILYLVQHKQPVDFITVTESLERHGHLDAVGGAAYLSSLTTGVPSAINAGSYARIIVDTAMRRRAIALAEELNTVAYNSNGSIAIDLLGIQTKISEILPQPDATAERTDDGTGVPPLPEAVHIDMEMAASAGDWIDVYTDYAVNVSPMTPLPFHQSAALWLVSSAIARRVVLKMAFANIYPNLWVMWVAPSTLFGKTTAMDIARDMAFQAFGHLLTPNDMTPEALIMDMAGVEPQNMMQLTYEDQQRWQERRNFAGQRAWTRDEFSGLLASAGRDYNAGMIETLMEFYNCIDPMQRLTAGRGLQIIKKSYLTLLAASTPTAMASHLQQERLWGVGWWPRFALLAPESDRPEWAEPRGQSPPHDLIAGLREVYERLPLPRWPEPITDIPALFDGQNVFDLWNVYNKTMRHDLLIDAAGLDARLYAYYGRLPVTALKIATILAVLDWTEKQPTPRIEMRHMMRALLIAEEFRSSAHNVLALALNASGDRMTQRIVDILTQNAPSGCTMRDLCKANQRAKPRDIERALQELLMSGDVIEVEYQNPRGGPKTTRYAIR